MRLILPVLIGLIQIGLIQNRAFAFLVDKVVAIVNNEVVLLSDMERLERTLPLRKELDPLFGFSDALNAGKPDNKTDKKNVLEFLVQERLIAQSFKVADNEVEQEVLTVQKNNNLSKNDLMEFLKTKGFNYDDYFELMRIGLQKRTLLDREIRSRVNISDDDVRNYYYNSLSKNTAVPIEYSISIIGFNFKTYRNAKSAQKVAQDTHRALRQGEDFAEMAKRLSDDPSNQQGGDLGYLTGEALAEPMRSSVKKLQIGSLSDVLESPTGYLIIKLNDIRSAEGQKIAEAKEQIRETLAREEYKKQLFLWAERSKNNAFVHVNE